VEGEGDFLTMASEKLPRKAASSEKQQKAVSSETQQDLDFVGLDWVDQTRQPGDLQPDPTENCPRYYWIDSPRMRDSCTDHVLPFGQYRPHQVWLLP
jgi:hypothetical protein